MARLALPIGVFRDREFFIHDGRRLRRFRLSASVQASFFFLAAILFGWSGYSAAQLVVAPAAERAAVSPYAAEIAKLAAETERRVKLVEARQFALAAALESKDIDPEALKRMGFYPAAGGGVGGPFDSASGDPTFKQLFTSWKKLDNLAGGAIAIPSDKPVKTAEFTSAFGVRADPFRRAHAMHAGIDLAGPVGTAIHATADGIVLGSGWNSGGYGNLVEIDHGRGIVTRYGHLSKMLVREGERVVRGQVIGRMGSTGRSTGSHLHYEVRIDDRPVNPIPFMRSTDYLIAMKRAGTAPAMDTVAVGGPGAGK
ncbi:MAG TPA: M23 family metallopeptidase [Sphingomicrobium sp.]|nr:M23 family metallopeptidase [Sphingomicrobium sp.]